MNMMITMMMRVMMMKMANIKTNMTCHTMAMEMMMIPTMTSNVRELPLA